MMYGYYGSMMGWGGGWGFFLFICWFVWTTVGVLLAIWLWQKIWKK